MRHKAAIGENGWAAAPEQRRRESRDITEPSPTPRGEQPASASIDEGHHDPAEREPQHPMFDVCGPKEVTRDSRPDIGNFKIKLCSTENQRQCGPQSQ